MRCICLVSTLLLWSAPAAAAAQGKTWVGETVLPTKQAKDIKFGDVINNQQVYYPFSGRWPFTVRAEKEGWLRLHDGRREGWVDKADFVTVGQAFAYFSGRIERNPDDDFALAMRGAYWLDKRQPDKAIADFDACIRLNAKDPTTFNNRGLAWMAKANYEKAIADYDEALRLNPQNTVTYNNRGAARRFRQEFDEAIADYHEAIRLEPTYANAWYGRGAAYLGKKEYDTALENFNGALKSDVKHVAAFNDRGLAWAAKKDYTKAIQDYTEALRIHPKNLVTFGNRAVAYRLLREYDRSVRDYEDALRLDPKHPRAFAGLSWLKATCPDERYRDGAKAVELATKACQLTDWKEPAYLDVLAAAHAETGDFAQAARSVKQALESARFEKQAGDAARRRLKLYEKGQAFRE